MKTRDILIKFRLTENEAEMIKSYADMCGITLSALIRMLIMGRRPKPATPQSFWNYMDILYEIHNGLQKAAEGNNDNSELAREIKCELEALILQLQAAITLPERICYGDNKNLGD